MNERTARLLEEHLGLAPEPLYFLDLIEVAVERDDVELLRRDVAYCARWVTGEDPRVIYSEMVASLGDDVLDAVYDIHDEIGQEVHSIPLQNPITSKGQVRVIRHRARARV